MKPGKNLSGYSRLALLWLGILTPTFICGYYFYFRSTITFLIPQYDAVNEAVYSEIKPPGGADEVEKYNIGISNPTNVFGRKLWIRYRYDSDSINKDGINSYYQQILLPSGWDINLIAKQSQNGSITGILFNRDRSCLYLYLFSNYYLIEIYQDFPSQSITPPLPLGLQLFNFGEANVITCP